MALCNLLRSNDNGCGCIIPLIIAFLIICNCDFNICDFVDGIFANADACSILLTIVFFLYVTGFFCDTAC